MRSVYDLTFLGLDVHKDTNSVAVLEPGAETAVVDKVPSDGASVRRLVGRFPDRASLSGVLRGRPTGTLARAARRAGRLDR